MSMLDDCEQETLWYVCELTVVVEHSVGPSIPPRYSSNGAYRSSGPAPVDISEVEYEGYEVAEEEEAEDSGMVRAVSG